MVRSQLEHCYGEEPAWTLLWWGASLNTAMVRSQLEHCSPIWRPVTSTQISRFESEHCSPIWRPVTSTQISRFESVQKSKIKWILNEEFISYLDNETYIKKCKEINILPISKKFDLNDLVFFHKIINGLLKPSYLIMFLNLLVNPDWKIITLTLNATSVI